jgi:hypothetical protein
LKVILVFQQALYPRGRCKKFGAPGVLPYPRGDQECLWYIMTACVLMHNMIIEDDHVKDHTHYELMGVRVQVARSAHKVARLIASHHCIRFKETHDEL